MEWNELMLLSATATTKEQSCEAIIAPVYSLMLTAHAYLWDWKTPHVKESMKVLTSLRGLIVKIIILGLSYRQIFSYIPGVIRSMWLAHLGWTSEPWQRFKVTDVKVGLIWNLCIIGGGTGRLRVSKFPQWRWCETRILCQRFTCFMDQMGHMSLYCLLGLKGDPSDFVSWSDCLAFQFQHMYSVAEFNW